MLTAVNLLSPGHSNCSLNLKMTRSPTNTDPEIVHFGLGRSIFSIMKRSCTWTEKVRN